MAKTRVKIAKSGGIVWDADQPKHTVIVEGQTYEVELTPMIGKKISEGVLVEVKEEPKKDATKPAADKADGKAAEGKAAESDDKK